MSLCSLISIHFLWLFEYSLKTKSANSVIWKHYNDYSCDLTDLSSSAFDASYELSLSECQDLCVNTTNCKGVSWYKHLKYRVSNDPQRCYLLNKLCSLKYFTISPVITSFWYKNIDEQTQCNNYPNFWHDRFGDDCDYYTSFKLCDGSFNNSLKSFILNDADPTYNFNAFQVCCSCAGSVYKYSYNNYEILIEPIWKSTNQISVDNSKICQTSLTEYNTDIYLKNSYQWMLNEFLGICNFLHINVYNKYRIIQSLLSKENQKTQANAFKQLSNFHCINNNIFYKNTSFYICNEFDDISYPFVIDLSQSPTKYTYYFNSHFIDVQYFYQNIQKTNQVKYKNQCNISSLIHNNLNSNIFTAAVCQLITFNPTMHPTTPPTPTPTHNPSIGPSLHPTNNPSASPTPPIMRYKSFRYLYNPLYPWCAGGNANWSKIDEIVKPIGCVGWTKYSCTKDSYTEAVYNDRNCSMALKAVYTYNLSCSDGLVWYNVSEYPDGLNRGGYIDEEILMLHCGKEEPFILNIQVTESEGTNGSWFKSQGRHTQIWIVVGSIIGFVCLCTCLGCCVYAINN